MAHEGICKVEFSRCFACSHHDKQAVGLPWVADAPLGTGQLSALLHGGLWSVAEGWLLWAALQGCSEVAHPGAVEQARVPDGRALIAAVPCLARFACRSCMG